MFGYIYKTTNMVNGKIYIGKRRGEFDDTYLGSGRYLNNSINKYGRDQFSVEVIDTCDSLSDQNSKERYWIAYYRATDATMYNISDGGDGGDTFSGMSIEDRVQRVEKLKANGYFSTISSDERKKLHELGTAKRSQTLSARREHNNGYAFTDLQRQRMSEAGKRRAPVSDETKAKILQSRINSDYHISEETKRKIAESNRGKTRSLEVRQEMSRRLKGKCTGSDNHFYGKTHSDDVKARIGELNKAGVCGGVGRIWINNGQLNKRVKPEELDAYKAQGFIEGRIPYKHKNPMPDERRKQISETLQGMPAWNKGLHKSEDARLKNFGANKGGIFMNNGQVNKLVRPEDVVIYTEAGFKLGMKPRKGAV